MDQIDCMEVARPPPAIGGARQRKSKKQKSKRSQRGGACGCNSQSQRGGGGGTGGYAVDVGSNDIGKMYSALIPGNCATVPSRAMVGGSRKQKQQQQRGGDSAATVYGLQSYSAGFDLNKPVEIPGGSAHYLDWTAYDNTCKGGARRSKKAKKAKRRSRN